MSHVKGCSKHVGAALCEDTLTDSAMSTEAFNPNPTIFAPAKSSRSVPAYAKANSLWLDEDEPDYEGEDESNESEEIDQEEIFGKYLPSSLRTQCVFPDIPFASAMIAVTLIQYVQS